MCNDPSSSWSHHKSKIRSSNDGILLLILLMLGYERMCVWRPSYFNIQIEQQVCIYSVGQSRSMSRQLFAIALSTERLQTLTGSTHFYVTSGDGLLSFKISTQRDERCTLNQWLLSTLTDRGEVGQSFSSPPFVQLASVCACYCGLTLFISFHIAQCHSVYLQTINVVWRNFCPHNS